MFRALLVLLLVVAGAAAIAHGLGIRKQLREQLDEGFTGALRSHYVAISATDRERVANFRWWSWMLIGGGCGMLALAIGGGMIGGTKPAAEKKPDKKKKGRKG